MKFLSITIFVFVALILNSCATRVKNYSTFWVSGYKSEASAGAGKMMVLNVYRGENLKNAKWENFYAPIEGFQFEEGVSQKIEVKETQLDPAKVPADASSIKYELVKVLERQKDLRSSEIKGDWILVELDGGPINRMVKVPTAKIDISTRMISGFGGCNNYSGKIENLTSKDFKTDKVLSTMMACMEKNIEPEFGKALSEVETYKIKDGKLYFYNASGKNVLTFIRKND